MTRPAKAPQQAKTLTRGEAMRMALGPGSQFIGPTESILSMVSCARSNRSSFDSRYRAQNRRLG